MLEDFFLPVRCKQKSLEWEKFAENVNNPKMILSTLPNENNLVDNKEQEGKLNIQYLCFLGVFLVTKNYEKIYLRTLDKLSHYIALLALWSDMAIVRWMSALKDRSIAIG